MCLTTAKTIQLLIGTIELLYVNCLFRDNTVVDVLDYIHTLTCVYFCTPMDAGGPAIRQS